MKTKPTPEVRILGFKFHRVNGVLQKSLHQPLANLKTLYTFAESKSRTFVVLGGHRLMLGFIAGFFCAQNLLISAVAFPTIFSCLRGRNVVTLTSGNGSRFFYSTINVKVTTV